MVRLNWWLILLLVGFYMFMIYVYVQQWGNNPLTLWSLAALAALWVVVCLFAGRLIMIIDDEFVIFRSDLWTRCKIPIAAIRNVDVKQVAWKEWHIPGKIIENHQFDLTWKAVVIELINDKIYRITLKYNTAQTIKNEINNRLTCAYAQVQAKLKT